MARLGVRQRLKLGCQGLCAPISFPRPWFTPGLRMEWCPSSWGGGACQFLTLCLLGRDLLGLAWGRDPLRGYSSPLPGTCWQHQALLALLLHQAGTTGCFLQGGAGWTHAHVPSWPWLGVRASMCVHVCVPWEVLVSGYVGGESEALNWEVGLRAAPSA